METRIVECPRCKGSIELERDAVDQEVHICEYCGAKIRYRVKSSDAVGARARVKELEHEEAMADKRHGHEIDLMDKAYEQEVDRDEREARQSAKVLVGALICFVAAFGILGVTSFFGENPGFLGGFNQAQVPKSASQIRGANHETIEIELKSLGFSDVESKGLGDKGGWLDFFDRRRHPLHIHQRRLGFQGGHLAQQGLKDNNQIPLVSRPAMMHSCSLEARGS